ncbi:14936_t:CDS:2 [Acaulospora colombiana]|uniref:14936_t:CDS:1 n=1 Tax=Acaulospora colombiana TaxID=27376 RepID=A0ACA9P442_9GLOM|nr:14936_t:CDS:2 [Acaulospora colombiana]
MFYNTHKERLGSTAAFEHNGLLRDGHAHTTHFLTATRKRCCTLVRDSAIGLSANQSPARHAGASYTWIAKFVWSAPPLLGKLNSEATPFEQSGRNVSVGEKDHITITQWQTETEIRYETVTTTREPTAQEKDRLASPPHLAVEGLLEKSLDELKDMIRHTNGYLARDWSLALGWNNIIPERRVVGTGIAGITIPESISTRNPKVVLKVMDLISESSGMTGLDDLVGRRRSLKARQDAAIGDDEWDIGYDDTEGGLGSSEGQVAPEDPPTDEAPSPPTTTEPPGSMNMIGQQYAARLQDELARKNQQVLDWSDARRILQELTNGIVQTQDFDEAGCERLLKAAGLGMEFTKTVVKPIRQVAPLPSLRSLTLDFSFKRYPQRVLLLEGELHLGRKPGGLRFTSVAAREDYARIVLQDLRPPEWVHTLASRLIRRMDYVRNGRAWLAAHMRRGDCECRFDRF